MTDGQIRAAHTIARETKDLLESLVAFNGTDRAGAATTAASLTLLLTGLAGRTPTDADGQSHHGESGIAFAVAVLDLLRDDIPSDLHTGRDLEANLPSYIPLEAEGHIMYGLTRLRSAIQIWTVLPGVVGPEMIQVGFAAGVREFIKANRTSRPNAAYELVLAIGSLIDPPRPVVQVQPTPVFQGYGHHGYAHRQSHHPHPQQPSAPRNGFHFEAAARAA